jgi:hypothetical protein
MVTENNTTMPLESQTEPQPVFTVSPGTRSRMTDEEFVRVKCSIERSLDIIDKVIERCLSPETGTPAITSQ